MAQLGIDTDRLLPMIPTRSVGQPDDFGAAVAFVCSDQAKFITGASLIIDGGQYRCLL